MPTNLVTVPQRLVQELDKATQELQVALRAYERAVAVRNQEMEDGRAAMQARSSISD
jgi:exonuclease VII small subunit